MIIVMMLKDGRCVRCVKRWKIALLQQFLIYFILCVICILYAKAQTDTLYPNTEYFKALQYFRPDFSVPDNKLELLSKLTKYYSLNNYLSDLARERKLDTIPQVQKNLSMILKIVENDYLANLVRNNIPDSVLKFQDKDIKDYYERNLSKFEIHGKVSYIKVFVSREGNMKKAKEILNEYQKNLPVSWTEIKKQDSDGIVVSSDFDLPLNDEQPFTELLKSAQKGQIIGPFDNDGRKVMLLILNITHNHYLPFNDVKKDCENMVRTEKVVNYWLNMEKKAIAKYPIKISPP